jgi:hypothetical protein
MREKEKWLHEHLLFMDLGQCGVHRNGCARWLAARAGLPVAGLWKKSIRFGNDRATGMGCNVCHFFCLESWLDLSARLIGIVLIIFSGIDQCALSLHPTCSY